jgi:aryl-alcohol dehydrogenase-like predicted oxidoreductase
MNKKQRSSITRKEFIKKSSAGVVGTGIILQKPLSWVSWNTEPEKRTLGRSGIEVTTLGFGASRTQEPALLLAALDTGINFIDTGRSYARGQNEVMVGKTVKDRRKDLIIQSKVRIRPSEKGDDLKTKEASKKIREMMQKSLDESLEALQTDYIDIWLIHGADSEEILHHETVMEFFSDLKQRGIIRATGFSSHHNQAELLEADNALNFYDVAMVSYTFSGSYTHSNSGTFSQYNQEALEREMKIAHQHQKGIIGMKACSAGPFKGKDDEKASFGNAIKWVLDKPYIQSAAVAMANFTQIEENTKAIFGS